MEGLRTGKRLSEVDVQGAAQVSTREHSRQRRGPSPAGRPPVTVDLGSLELAHAQQGFCQVLRHGGEGVQF